jgi:dolichyl-phosphate-mannose-protein mannosyltransferase
MAVVRANVAVAGRPLARERETERSWTRTDSIALSGVTLIAGALRLFRVTAVPHKVFDEVFYATQGCAYVYGTAPCDPRGVTDLPPVHPPLGTWLIAGGIRLFGNRSGGWRVAPLVAGTLTVALLYLLARRIVRSTVAAVVASGALAIDFLHFVQSRVAMLDIFVAFFGVAAVLFAVYDRDRAIAPGVDGASRGLGERLYARRWRLLAGIAAGAAVASKWSGLWFLLVVGLLTIAWEVARRKDANGRAAMRGAIVAEGPSIVVAFAILPALVYVASYAGRIDGPILALPWAEGSWARSLLGQQRAMLRFHLGLDVPHVYGSPPWSWPLLKRPLVYDIEVAGDRYREIMATGDPLAWWPGLAALAYAAVRWLRRHRSDGEAIIVAGFAAGWLPWLILAPARQTSFLFYLLPSVPFLCLALGYAAAAVVRLRWGSAMTLSYAGAVLASFVFFYPVLAAVPVPEDAWRARVLFDDCDLQGVSLSTIELPAGVTPPPDTPGPYPEATMRGSPPDGWCWI